MPIVDEDEVAALDLLDGERGDRVLRGACGEGEAGLRVQAGEGVGRGLHVSRRNAEATAEFGPAMREHLVEGFPDKSLGERPRQSRLV